MQPSIETQAKIAALREKARSGTMTLEDCKEAIAFLRQERVAMPPATAKPRTKAAPINADDLLKGLGI